MIDDFTTSYNQGMIEQLKRLEPGQRVNALVRIVYSEENPARVMGTVISSRLVERNGLNNIKVKLRGDDGVIYDKFAYELFYSNIIPVDADHTLNHG